MGVSDGRGVDNTTAGWTTDYLLATVLLYLRDAAGEGGGETLFPLCGLHVARWLPVASRFWSNFVGAACVSFYLTLHSGMKS